MSVPITYYQRNRSKILEYSKAYNKSHPEIVRAATKKYRLANPERTQALDRKRNLKAILKHHGMALSEYETMLKKQKGACAICGEQGSQRLSFDHNHSTGKVRGLLCHRCNFGIGQFRDDTNLLLAAAVYLTDTLEV